MNDAYQGDPRHPGILDFWNYKQLQFSPRNAWFGKATWSRGVRRTLWRAFQVEKRRRDRESPIFLTRSGVTLAALELPLLQKVPEKVSMRDTFPPALYVQKFKSTVGTSWFCHATSQTFWSNPVVQNLSEYFQVYILFVAHSMWPKFWADICLQNIE